MLASVRYDKPIINTSLQTISVFSLMYLNLRVDNTQGAILGLPRLQQGIKDIYSDSKEPGGARWSALSAGYIIHEICCQHC